MVIPVASERRDGELIFQYAKRLLKENPDLSVTVNAMFVRIKKGVDIKLLLAPSRMRKLSNKSKSMPVSAYKYHSQFLNMKIKHPHIIEFKRIGLYIAEFSKILHIKYQRFKKKYPGITVSFIYVDKGPFDTKNFKAVSLASRKSPNYNGVITRAEANILALTKLGYSKDFARIRGAKNVSTRPHTFYNGKKMSIESFLLLHNLRPGFYYSNVRHTITDTKAETILEAYKRIRAKMRPRYKPLTHNGIYYKTTSDFVRMVAKKFNTDEDLIRSYNKYYNDPDKTYNFYKNKYKNNRAPGETEEATADSIVTEPCF